VRVLDQQEWQQLAAAHAARVRPWAADRVARRSAGRPHAVWDFLFDYYPYSPGRLATWHPGHGVVLSGPAAGAYLSERGYVSVDGGVTADLSAASAGRLAVAIAILAGTHGRPAALGCFGLHEWAMTYGLAQEEVRHAYVPLRLAPEEISRTVESIGLRCTHIDAYRFFTPDAAPLNAHVPTRDSQADDEQPGCLHASMDLYKYACWFAPLVGSDLVADCFENAATARELDMRASPYDVSSFGLAPVRVETAAGRREYVELQSALAERSAPLRERLLSTLRELVASRG
jgi:hypothetical protein